MRYEERGVFTSKSFVVNIPDDCGYEIRFNHNIDLRTEGVSATYIDWCVDNCFGKFGWWFTRRGSNRDSNAYLSFENEEDLVLFNLTHDITN